MSKNKTVELTGLRQAVDSIPNALLQAMGVSETQSKPITETLDEWVNVRFQVDSLEAKRREIQPLAIAQLKDLLEAQGKEKGAGYEVSGHQVILKTRKSTPKLEEIDGVEAIQFEMEEEVKRLHSQPEVKSILTEVTLLSERLQELQFQYENLICSENLTRLKTELEKLIQAATKETEVLELRQIKNGRK